MTPLPEAEIARLKAGYEGCFGCGAANPIGIGLSGFGVAGDGTVTASFRPRVDHRGFAGVLHGGILASALDEMLAWTAMIREGVLVLTARLELRYRRPAPLDGAYRLVGRIDERRGRRLLLSGECRSAEGIVAQAEGLFLVAEEIAPPEA